MGTEEPKPAQIDETRTLATDEEGDAVETDQDGQDDAGDQADDETED